VNKGWLAGLALAACLACAADEPRTPSEHRRGEDQTFLTFPEWYLVHSPAELAQYLDLHRAPSAFPWFGHVGQFWQGYLAATRETRTYPFNAGYHLMVSSSDGRPTAEEKLGARVAQAYVDFIRVDPWYLFDFVAPLRELWSDATPWTGANLLRKWERRFALSTEYIVKAGYAWLIKLGTQSVYGTATPVTAVVLDRALAAPLPRDLTQFKRLDASPEATLAAVPRYRAFMTYAQALASQGVNFVEIAGNRGQIVASVIERSDAARPTAPQRELFVQPVLTQRGWERRVVALPVAELAAQLRRWKAAGVQVEYVYDY
jgi:hypothetical protein